MLRGGFVDPHISGTAGLEHPRRGAADDPADNRSGAGDLLVALPVAKLVAANLACVAAAIPVGAVALAAVPALHIAVDVVAGTTTAQARAVGLPPASGKRASRAAVGPRHGAAHRGVARIAGGVGPTHYGICGDRAKDISNRGHRERRPGDCHPGEEAPAVRCGGEERRAGVDQSCGHDAPISMPAKVPLTLETTEFRLAMLPITTYRQKARPWAEKNCWTPAWPRMVR